jgi:hypothetical protein
VFTLREVLQDSRMHVAQLIKRSAADVDQILKRIKARIHNSHNNDLPLLRKSDIERPVKIAQDLMDSPLYGSAKAPD